MGRGEVILSVGCFDYGGRVPAPFMKDRLGEIKREPSRLGMGRLGREDPAPCGPGETTRYYKLYPARYFVY